MSAVKNTRKLHQWLMLFIGTQFVIWSVTGAYMVFFDIDYIHGDSLVINHQTKINPDNIQYSLSSLQQRYPKAERVTLSTFINKEVYHFSVENKKYLVSARNGKLLSPLDENLAIEAAKHYYSGNGTVVDVELFIENPPFELSSRHLPAWRVNFDDIGAPAIYVSEQSGLLVGKRHEFWRLFDWMFRFHVMDYQDSEIENNLLFWFALFGIIASISGVVLVYFRVFKRNKKAVRFKFVNKSGIA